jgi:hypothetical protein
MQIIHEQVVKEYLVELEEDEVDRVDAAGFVIVRAEADEGGKARTVIYEGQLVDLVKAAYGHLAGQDFLKMMREMLARP